MISGQSFIKVNCHNSRTSDDIEMKLGPVTEPDKRKITTSKKLTMSSCHQIVTSLSFFWFMANLEQSGSQIPDAQFIKLFDDPKKASGASGGRSKVRTNVTKVLAQELHQWLKNSKEENCMQNFKDNIWAANIAKVGSISLMNHGAKYLLCVIDVFIKYAWVNSLKDKKTMTLFHSFIGIVNESKGNHTNNGLIKEKDFTILFCKNG